MFIVPTFLLYDYFVEYPLFHFVWTHISKQILWGILFGSASRVNWDELTLSEMVQDIESIGQRDWFIYIIFWVYRLETITE